LNAARKGIASEAKLEEEGEEETKIKKKFS
jgi:hypothetical protein